LVRALP